MSTRGRQPRARGEGPGAERPADERGGGSGGGDGELLRALEEGLEDVFPGLEILDRDLVLDEGGRADLAALEPSGRLVLVLVAEDLDRTPLEALDALSFARRHGALFARHFRRQAGQRLESELAPRLVVVTPTTDERLTQRLAPLFDCGLELYGVRTLASRAGERSYLVPLSVQAGDAVDRARSGRDAFLEALPADLVPFARAAITRIERLDDELEPAFGRETASWRLHGEVLVRIERAGSLLRASVSPHDERLLLEGDEALETLLESALERLMAILERSGGAPGPGTGGPGSPGEPGGTTALRLAGGPEDAPPTPRALLRSGEPLLTPEEIQAFRD